MRALGAAARFLEVVILHGWTRRGMGTIPIRGSSIGNSDHPCVRIALNVHYRYGFREIEPCILTKSQMFDII